MKKNIKNELGVVATDTVIAIMIIAVFASIIATVSYNIYLASTSTKRNSKATEYMISTFETIEGMNYNNVTQNSVNTVISDLNAPNGYNITANVQNYTIEGQSTEDLIKIIDLDIQYKVGNEEQVISANHIKARENIGGVGN